ncbi:hypothetical protein L4D06_00400 [Enterovibrio makurazakiensis]|uniref:hypothetical protein n=1 Tax=Enterovibrio makurazakiensis TaxID=2910232 RepID=UPI003D1D4927
MKYFYTILTAMLLSVSLGASAYVLEGKQVVVSKDAMQYCAAANNFWVCVNNHEMMRGD